MTTLHALSAFHLRWPCVPHRLGELGFCIATSEAVGAPLPLSRVGLYAEAPDGLDALALQHTGNWEQCVRAASSGAAVCVAGTGNVPGRGEQGAEGRPLRASGGVHLWPLPSMRLLGVGRRRAVAGGLDILVAPETRHRVTLPRALVEGLQGASLDGARVVLRGFYVRPIAYKTWAATIVPDDHPLDRWVAQGTHLRQLKVALKIEGWDEDTITFALDAGAVGGHADDLDPAQRWTGFDGYIMSLQAVLITGGEASEEDSVELELGDRPPRTAATTFPRAISGVDAAGLSAFEVNVRALHAGRLEAGEGRLIGALTVAWRDGDRLEAQISNGGIGAGALDASVRVTRAYVRRGTPQGMV